MADTEEFTLNCEFLLEHLKTMPWCKQGEKTLVAVHKATPEVIDAMRGKEVKVFPGGVNVKMNKSLLHSFQEKFNEGQPLPVVVVWKTEGVEIWYRRHKSEQFPYDSWTDSSAAAYERERAFIPAEQLGADFAPALDEIAARTKECPTMVPAY